MITEDTHAMYKIMKRNENEILAVDRGYTDF